MSDYILYGDQAAKVVRDAVSEFFTQSAGLNSASPFEMNEFVLCSTDDAGFHINGGKGLQTEWRTTKRDGADAYAYRCQVCGTVGDIIDGRFVARKVGA